MIYSKKKKKIQNQPKIGQFSNILDLISINPNLKTFYVFYLLPFLPSIYDSFFFFYKLWTSL